MASLVAVARLWTANHRPATMRLPAMHLPAMRPTAAMWLARRTIIYSAKGPRPPPSRSTGHRPNPLPFCSPTVSCRSFRVHTDRAVFDKYGVQPDETANIPSTILDKIGRNLHNQPHHPLQMAKRLVVDSLNRRYASPLYLVQ